MRPRADLQLVRGDVVPVTAPPCCAHERRAEALEAALAQAEGRRLDAVRALCDYMEENAERGGLGVIGVLVLLGVGAVIASATWAVVWWLS